MLGTLILKEIHETIQSYRFFIAMLLCVILIPLGFFVTLKDYELRLSDYNESMRIYHEQSDGRINYRFQAEGYRPPSSRSVFAVGLEYFLPNKVVTNHEGHYRILNSSGINNPQSLLFGKVDFLFNVNFVLTLLALIFTFGCISGEKESGTLRLIMAQPTHRWKLLLAKVTGNFLVFLAPFIISVVLGFVIIMLTGSNAALSGEFLTAFLVIFFVTLLFIFSIFTLGMFVSSLTRQSMTSMISLLFVWTVLVLVVPKISPMIAQALYPVKSEQVVNIEKQAARADVEQELDRKRRELFEAVMIRNGADPGNLTSYNSQTDEGKKAYDQYDKEKIPLETEYKKRRALQLARLDQDYVNKKNIQVSIAMNISRISPASCYTYIVSELSGTGPLEMNNFLAHAGRFQDRLNAELYDKIILTSYGNTRGSMVMNSTTTEGFKPNELSVPHLMPYHHISLREAMKNGWVDILLLGLFNILFFTASFVSFLRYDVR